MRKKLLLKGPILSRSGYGEQARFALRALKRHEDKFEIFLENIPWGKSSHITADNEMRQWIDDQFMKTLAFKQQKGVPDIALQITIPNEWEKIAPINIGYTAGIETTRVAPQWLAKGNDMDKIIVVSGHSKQVYETTTAEAQDTRTGQKIENYSCETPIEVVNYAVRQFESDPIQGLDLDYDSNLLVVAQWGPRKNLENTIKWFVEEFKDEEVGLILKTNMIKDSFIDRAHTTQQLRALLHPYADRKCKIYLLHGTLSDENMTWLYNHKKINALVSLAHGEGFGLPIFEAAYNGMPLVTINWGGQADFINMPGKRGKIRPHISKVQYHLKPIQKEAVWNGVLEENSMWAYPVEKSAKDAMRTVFKNADRVKSQAKKLQKWLRKNFTEEEQYDKFVNAIIGKASGDVRPVKGISFCIPTNGQKQVKTQQLLNSITHQMTIPYEIILCGDTSVFADLENVTLIDMTEEANSRKVASLRNASAAAAQYDTIVWCDDDILLSPAWLKDTLEHSSRYEWSVLGNRILNPDGTRHWDRATINPRVLVDYAHPSYSKNLLQTSGFFAVRKEVFEQVKWDENCLVYADRIEGQIPEDLQYSLDLVKAGYHLDFNAAAIVWHNDESYTEWESQTLLKTLIEEKLGLSFFPEPCEEYQTIADESL